MTLPIHPENVLVVDSDPRSRSAAASCLATAGYRATPAEDGPTALVAFERARPDLVLLELSLPGMDGVETCKRVRMLDGGSDVSIVFSSGSSQQQASYAAAIASGADDFVAKPFEPVELIGRVRSHLAGRRLATEASRMQALVASQREALDRAARVQTALLTSLAHDIRNPLAIILCNAHIVDHHDVKSAIRECARDIADAGASINRTLRMVLSVTQEEILPTAAPTEIDPTVLIGEARDALERRLADYAKKLVANVELGEARLRGDADLLRRSLEGLLDYCIRYGARAAPIQLDATRKAERWLAIEIRDETLVVAEDALGDIPSGRWLALAFSHHVATRHRGTFTVEPRAGGGTTFRLTLPYV